MIVYIAFFYLFVFYVFHDGLCISLVGNRSIAVKESHRVEDLIIMKFWQLRSISLYGKVNDFLRIVICEMVFRS